MVFLVPYDGSKLSKAALERAAEYAAATDSEVQVLSVVPDDPGFARERGWVGEDDTYEPEALAAQFEKDVAEHAPNASFRWEPPDDARMETSTTTDVARTIREVAREVNAEMVVIGSENAGRVSSPITSVGEPVSRDPDYDVLIVRHT